MTDDLSTPDLPELIAAVPPRHGADEPAPGSPDAPTARLLAAEAAFLRTWRGPPEGDAPSRSGLALSGGGVRSAAFALGVLQVLAGRRLLERFDYLSSVSGGGFAAGALIRLLDTAPTSRFGTGARDFPFGAVRDADADADAGEAVALLDFVRQHGAYLVPGHGITPSSAVAVVLRGILLNLLVWIPILVFVMLALLLASALVDGGSGAGRGGGAPLAFDVLLRIAIGFGALFTLASLAYSLSTHPRWNVRKRRYLLHRAFETRLPWIVWPLVGFLTLASLPWAADASLGFVGQFGGAAFVAIGLGIGLWSFLRPGDSWGAAFVRKRALPLGALLALYGVLLFAYQSAVWLLVEGTPLARGIAAVLLVVAVLSGWLVNLNYISVQRFYRDRLMEAFMPDVDRAIGQQGGPAAEADGRRLSDCLDPARTNGPYPLFNTHVPLASARSRRRRLRGGDNFILSPLYCGSSATGWTRTGRFMEDGMTLPTAMAISGSVNHQQSGLGGVGIALNPLVSLLKVLLNLRMGYWVPNPGSDDQSRRPNHFVPGLGEALGIGQDEEDPFLLLEDGGYFDNLGLYELVRRRLRLILVCDAGADAEARLSDLHRVVRRVETDFGARVEFDGPEDYLAVIPLEAARYPEGAELAGRGHLLGRIRYADGTRGTLLYLKSALVPGLDFDELGFGSRRAGFPQESTADQFFDEEQFDAHRRLGCALAGRLVDEVDVARLLGAADGDRARRTGGS